MPFTFIPNPAGIAAVEHAPGVKLATYAKAVEIAGYAKLIAPVDTGAYRDSIDAKLEGEGSRVETDSPYWIYLEYGTSDTPTFAVFRRALEAARVL